ncbi:hypothetical protein ACN1C3_16270 [Pseudomonas sp. H11T01]|uniref:hypothetical protein n=1 Tax=Pseudomonas sp. H11T01 TaxID=3402749 RepID=UPI003AC3A7AF
MSWDNRMILICEQHCTPLIVGLGAMAGPYGACKTALRLALASAGGCRARERLLGGGISGARRNFDKSVTCFFLGWQWGFARKFLSFDAFHRAQIKPMLRRLSSKSAKSCSAMCFFQDVEIGK